MEAVADSTSAENTRQLARKLGEALRPGDVVALSGDLGAGKTQFVKGLALGAGVPDADLVTSPTFVLMNRYEGRLPVRHFDFYRVEQVDLASLGYFDLLDESATVVEWAEKAGGALGDRLEILFEATGPTLRRLTFRPLGERARDLLSRAPS
ncbi:MAG: tRNA (adenosine(37)-N6)-threonylcarbamoyltransferase complex ATPase subunit type 1 TsaE [Planctomycetes bacterium]|nr:tRNA (adenosine(37)-N6)-threonylcarbamoyltransferase complex ATPase subunit type 1 TsaE [Planctomycetota bacterium]